MIIIIEDARNSKRFKFDVSDSVKIQRLLDATLKQMDIGDDPFESENTYCLFYAPPHKRAFELNPDETTDIETLGLSGAINKRLYESRWMINSHFSFQQTDI